MHPAKVSVQGIIAFQLQAARGIEVPYNRERPRPGGVVLLYCS